MKAHRLHGADRNAFAVAAGRLANLLLFMVSRPLQSPTPAISKTAPRRPPVLEMLAIVCQTPDQATRSYEQVEDLEANCILPLAMGEHVRLAEPGVMARRSRKLASTTFRDRLPKSGTAVVIRRMEIA